MAKLVLTQIMKNESHIAERMLNSIREIVDGICIVDTGSTDNSIEIVKKWGIDNNIEVHIFERPFDNFENSRNFALQKTREIYQGDEYYGFWLDFDEMIVIDDKFDKESIDKDIYMFETHIDSMVYTRVELFKLNKKFRWYGIVHEFIVSDDEDITKGGKLEGLKVIVQKDGASWSDDINEKYKKHANLLEAHIDSDRSDPRWIFYTAQSYYDSANTNDRHINEERLRRSLEYYKERVLRKDGYEEERFYSQWKVGVIMERLEMPWGDTYNEFMKAHSMDVLRAEPIKSIIDHYLKVGEWNSAYLYSKVALINFHNKNPFPKRLLFIRSEMYNWQLLDIHSASCYYTNRLEEGKAVYNELLKIVDNSPQLFSENDKIKIESNKKLFFK